MALPTTRPRRTQAERRAATRAALLDATIESLVKYGYANLTTGAIVKQAGVSRGAHAHYFSSKPDLMVQALDHLAEKISTDVERSLTPTRSKSMVDYESLIDRLWDYHRGPLFAAAIELWVAARTEPELRSHLRRFDRELMAHLGLLAAKYVPALMAIPDFQSKFVTAMAAMRGVAMLSFSASAETVERTWAAVRFEIVGLGKPHLEDTATPD
ncbi:TetR/AcrR family transcriptional regulator [Nocardia sp. NPDC059180]|uniref:TetR/AcrR family transcriptional regulator n=1 Tax=Nocardia sp. NPDC059180 TaxID=3346761 RepID=UPI0036BAB0F2